MKELYRANEALVKRLNDSINKNSVFHAQVFISRHPQDRESFAGDFIKAILSHREMGDYSDEKICRKVDGEKHEDVIVLRREKSTVPVEAVRKMQDRIKIKPMGERYVILIIDGDMMNDVSQNTLLKTLEEPPGETVIIILAEDVENLLPTVRSRCIIHNLEEGEVRSNEEVRKIAEEIMKLSGEGAAYYRLSKAAEALGKDRDEVRGFLDISEEICSRRLFERNEKGIPYSREKTAEDIHAIENARRRLDRGMSVRFTIKELLLKIGG